MKREHRNDGPIVSPHNICLKDVRGELPIGSVAGKIFEGSLDVRPECRTRAVKMCTAALRHPWVHSPHCNADGDLRWSCFQCGKKLQSLNGCFPVYRGRALRSSSVLPPVMDSCYLETLVKQNSELHQRSCLGPRRSKLIGAARRLSTGPVRTVDGVYLRSLHEHGCLRHSILKLMVRCCKRKKRLSVMIFGSRDARLL